MCSVRRLTTDFHNRSIDGALVKDVLPEYHDNASEALQFIRTTDELSSQMLNGSVSFIICKCSVAGNHYALMVMFLSETSKFRVSCCIDLLLKRWFVMIGVWLL